MDLVRVMSETGGVTQRLGWLGIMGCAGLIATMEGSVV